MEKSRKFRYEKKSIVKKSRNIIFNIKLFNNFYEYLEHTWLQLGDCEYVEFKFKFKLCSYINKFNFKNARNKVLISKSPLDNYIFI